MQQSWFATFWLSGCANYRRLMFDFLSTVSHIKGNDHYTSQVWEKPDRVYFRLMNRDFDLSLTEWCNCFGFTNNLNQSSTHGSLMPNYWLNPR
jgi:hypothetical protein